jgi:parvulin-like peptidyl-prolyl isomerase
LIGPLILTDLAEDLQKLVRGMKVGEITPVLRAQKGYQLLKLESSSAAETVPFEQAREQISERVFTEKRRAEFDKYLTKLRAEAIIDWKNQDIRKAFELGLERAKAGLTSGL